MGKEKRQNTCQVKSSKMTTEETLTQTIQAKAKELKITPKLLLFALAVLHEKPNAREADVFNPYFKSLVRDMKTQAERQKIDKNKKRREAGEYALQEAGKTIESFLETVKKAVNISDIEAPVLNLHSVALNHLMADKNKIIQKSSTAEKIKSDLDAVQILRLKYSGLIQQFSEVSGFFKENDLNEN
jgi:hypothetical protein